MGELSWQWAEAKKKASWWQLYYLVELGRKYYIVRVVEMKLDATSRSSNGLSSGGW